MKVSDLRKFLDQLGPDSNNFDLVIDFEDCLCDVRAVDVMKDPEADPCFIVRLTAET